MDEDEVTLEYCDTCGMFVNEWIAYEQCEENECPYFTTGQELNPEYD